MKTEAEVLRYADRKGWTYKFEGDQIRIKECPFCHDDGYHFYINRKTGQYSCFKCSDKSSKTKTTIGNLYKLKKELGDIHPVSTVSDSDPDEDKPILPKGRYKKVVSRIKGYHKNLLDSRKTLKYLEAKRGFDLDVVIQFKLGLKVDRRKGVKYLVIPYFEDGKLVNAKFRTLPPAKKEFHRVTGMKSTLYNVDSLDYSLNYAILVEGETDAIAGSTFGAQNVVGTTVGARGFKAAWMDVLTRFEIVYLIYDPDEVGQEGAYSMAKRIGPERCKNVVLPDGMDLNEYYKSGHDYDDFKKLLDNASFFDVEGVLSLKVALSNLEERLSKDGTVSQSGIFTPWQNVNKLMGGMISGDLIIVSGRPKIGKSTWGLNTLLHNSMQGIPSLYYCLEMRPERIAPKIVSFFRSVGTNQITRDDVIYVETLYRNKPLYMAYSYSFDSDVVYETIRESVMRYGIEIVLFDNLHFLVRSGDVTNDVSFAVRQFKLIAEELGVPIILIAQGRKMSGTGKRMTMDDLRDSSSIGTDGDTIIILHRDRIPHFQNGSPKSDGDMYSSSTEVIVEAARYNPGGVATLEYAGEWSRFFTSKTEKTNFGRRRGKGGFKS